MPPFRSRDDGIDLCVRLTPKAALDRIEGVETTADGRSHLKARVRALPENGAANAALVKLVAKALGVPASAVAVVAGGTARLKTLRIVGDAAELAKRIEALSGGQGKPH
ncbi:DUF167 domain-containing protein [Mesorhizobium sp. M4B.F.Ca.ET.215.01.1.1]|uniref:DUF167 family protein n=1 Tax=unclassified Mesorhizobium TaxID=325217 RepID=UPI000FCB3CC6|nr:MULTISPECIES: DUF167 family protein [unclassified Mesorhizobium]RUW27234.1 DUF167 domain-containing protein [Mesorhizobium sp. M4B.F.Ca.ET.013.02.1.1]RVD41228.1 DUF167 domain-containing protein [Mesorhizobium sp. M4B.F.Ca.ET.019.03.1.1]RWF61757.1 MAG: DUF167 domain-containing protein [Mesorhizobium sp.]TGQ10803.1 DUF167 domain-containing protein [Mesorhizobium sp. M4B.F.Ca.ET.215.01.1.1]TGQ36381.1 DUF167 domain-containing protein [Mesorhizobium sp. M4B.F.Ca.ET.214.01.1.1]